MSDLTEIEWCYEPPDFFEAPHRHSAGKALELDKRS